MKAKRLRDGKIVEVEKHGDAMIDEDGKVLYFDEICEVDEPDWQQVRIQAAIAVLQGITPEWGNNAKQYAEWAVRVADALVEELQKKGGQEQ